MCKVAIVGANSYIARNVIFKLKEECPGVQLYLYDYADKHIEDCSNYKKINILSKESIKQIDFTCDVMYMFIGKTGTEIGFTEFDTFIDINERALLNLLQAYVESKSNAKIIFPSTRLVYKGCHGRLTEDAEKEFKTIYAINKYSCEQYLKMYHEIFNVRYCIFRICVPYGTLISNASSYGTAEFMLEKVKKGENISLYGDGSVRRTLTYMGDLCDVLIKGALCDQCENDVFNVGGEDYSLKEMAELIAAKYRVTVEYVPYPDMALKIESGDTVFEDKKIQKILGKFSFEGRFEEWIKN